jgi:drug/metabolite transporter (DMT)-like permease
MNVVLCGVASVSYWILLAAGPPLAAYGEVLPIEWAFLIGSVLVGHALGDTLFLSALKEIGVARTLALVGTYPLSTLFFQWLLLQHSIHSGLAAGSVLVALGVVCLSKRSGTDAEDPGAREGRLALGVVLSLSASLLWGLGTVFLEPALAHMTPVQANSICMPLVAIVLYVTRCRGRGKVGLRDIDRRTGTILVVAGVLGMGGGSLLFFTALEMIGPAKIATLSSASPVFGMLMAVVFLKEHVTFRIVAGVVLCIAGVWLVL